VLAKSKMLAPAMVVAALIVAAPAFNRGLQMSVGGGVGTVLAAQVSPALAVCETSQPRPS
jgi:hypothetical protein